MNTRERTRGMPTYVYETVPSAENGAAERFEIKQSFNDPPLEVHPETGVPVRRVISGGIGLATKSGMELPEPGCGAGTCRCGRVA